MLRHAGAHPSMKSVRRVSCCGYRPSLTRHSRRNSPAPTITVALKTRPRKYSANYVLCSICKYVSINKVPNVMEANGKWWYISTSCLYTLKENTHYNAWVSFPFLRMLNVRHPLLLRTRHKLEQKRPPNVSLWSIQTCVLSESVPVPSSWWQKL